MPAPERVGVYGGTFDPVHIGHLAIAEEARWALGLSRVYVVPAAQQPLKANSHDASPAQRLAMVRLACADNPGLAPSDIELHRPPPSYTVDTLAEFRERLGPAVELHFILGADAAAELPRWRSAAAILGLARLAIVGRPGYTIDIAALDAALPGLAARATPIDGPRLDISSTELRRRLAAGQPARYQIPDPVLRYIEEHGFYRD
jgi:nicotinate-nucleotide adenylyltransferase